MQGVKREPRIFDIQMIPLRELTYGGLETRALQRKNPAKNGRAQGSRHQTGRARSPGWCSSSGTVLTTDQKASCIVSSHSDSTTIHIHMGILGSWYRLHICRNTRFDQRQIINAKSTRRIGLSYITSNRHRRWWTVP